jgi:hypothetical protein
VGDTARQSIAKTIAKLAIGRGSSADDATVEVYVTLLEDLSAPAVSRACLELAKLPRADYEPSLPSAGTIREKVAEMQRAKLSEEALRKLLPMPMGDDDPRALTFCQDCHDEPSGWREFMCPERPCGRRPSAAHRSAHTYVERCHCWQVNPAVAQRKRVMEAGRKSAAR